MGEESRRPPAVARGRRAVVLLARGEAAETADRLRRRFDVEWFERVPPHVTLAAPFDPGEVGADREIALRLREAVAAAAPFFLELGPPGAFIVPDLVLHLSVRNAGPVRELEGAVRRALGLGGPGRPFVPHLTIGRFASQAAMAVGLAAVREELARRPPGPGRTGFRVDAVDLFAEEPETGVYSSVAVAVLAGGEPRAEAADP